MANRPVFFDASGRRAFQISLFSWTVAIISTVVGLAFLASLIAVPRLSSVALPGHLSAVPSNQLVDAAKAPGLLRSAKRLSLRAHRRRLKIVHEMQRRQAHAKLNNAVARILQPQATRALSIAFYPTWSDNTFASLKRALPSLDWVVPTWLTLDGDAPTLKESYDAHLAKYIRGRKPGTAILPVLQNLNAGSWNGPGLVHLLKSEEKRKTLIANVATYLQTHKLQGLVIDFEDFPKSSRGDLRVFLTELTRAFTPHGWITVLATPVGDDSWPYARMAKAVDYTMLMVYDEHWSSGPEGPIAGQSWFENILDKHMKVLNPSRTIVAIGSYGYDWNGGDVDDITFQDAVIAAHDSEAKVTFDPDTNNPHFSYMEDDNVKHDIWFLDGATAFNEIHAADPYKPAGYAVWKLGGEDPTIWSLMGRPYESPAPAALKNIPIIDDIDFEGRGEFMSVAAEPTSGTRTFEAEPQVGDITDETYTRLPTTYVIHKFGAADKKLALTFDDGPDPDWTPQILDILKEKHVPATFFDVGDNAEANPDLVEREVEEGNEVGSHTFTHPNLSVTPAEAVKLELNATQRLFEALTGRSLRLFRPPYLGDSNPTDADEIVPIKIAQDLGYIAVGLNVDPLDWARPGTQQIIDRTIQQVNEASENMPRNVVLLHDGGGDRSETVAALPVIIDRLRAEGYTFVPASDLIKLTRNDVMPKLPLTVSLLTDRAVFLTMSTLGHTLYWAFLLAIWIGIARLVFLVALSLIRRRKEMKTVEPPLLPERFRVTVIVPAYNEENVIVPTIEGILASHYENLEVILVNDGSQDDTLGVAQRRFKNNRRVRIIDIPNGGKANALNTAIGHATGEVVVALDADTQFEPDAISRLVRWFSDAEVGAVAGNAKVGNRVNMVTRWQALEYISAQNLERRALAALNTLTVVPGAIGAWRRSALEDLGGFAGDTLAEDQDLTIAMQKAGYRIVFDSSAVAWTEAPATFGGLQRQRFRWSYGTLQCLWKHRDATLRPRFKALGMIALPQVWLFQIILTAIAPLADLLLVWQLVSQWIAWAEHGAEFRTGDLQLIGIYYVIFTLVDLAAAAFGFLMEKREDWRLLWWLVLQRFGYRQLMYYVVVRSIVTAIRGPFVGWGKLERMGTVTRKSAA